MALYGGIDLHANNCVIVSIDDQDRVVDHKRLPNQLECILARLAPYQTEIKGLVVESTYNGYWLVDGLIEWGYPVHLANTAAIQQYEGIKYSNDFSDAQWLAHLLRLGVLPEGYLYPQATRGVRDLLRKRRQLVQQRPANLLSIQTQSARNTGQTWKANRIKRLSCEEVEQEGFDAYLALSITSNLTVMQCLETPIRTLEKVIKGQVKLDPAFAPWRTVPGIGDILGLTIMLETGDIGRFASVGDFASYCRCVGSERLSNGKRTGRGNTKNGNKYLAWAFVEAANVAVRYDPHIKRYSQRKAAKTHTIVATKTKVKKVAKRGRLSLDTNRLNGDPFTRLPSIRPCPTILQAAGYSFAPIFSRRIPAACA
jgi:transposase